MKKSILALTLAVLMMSMVGCQESQVQKANPKQDINKVLVKLQAAYVKQDIETIMSFYSENYEGGNGEGKEQLAQFLNGMKDQGYLADTELVLDDVKIKVKGNTATVAPMKYTGSWGEVEYKTTFKKEGSNWKVIGGEEYSGE